ncbi:MAG: hypothetical protein AB7K52_14620 [Phycisphaerales bacterium]
MNTTRDSFEPVALTITCLHLRHKLMYVDDRHATPGLVDDSSSTRVFLCLKSHDALGPDGEPVSPRLCNSSRPCHCGDASAPSTRPGRTPTA